MIFLLIALVVLPVVILHVNRIKIEWSSLIKPTIPLDTGVFGVYCFDGKQGTGKTYSITKYIKKHGEGKQVYSNMTFYGIDYIPINSLDELFSLSEKQNVLIVYDEILNILNDKRIPQTIRDDLMKFLTQQRKVKNIFLTSTQSWLRVPIEFRDFVRIQIKVKTRPLGRWGGILREEYRDADDMKWSQLDNEYVAPRIQVKYSKYEKKFMQSYDTYERIAKLKKVGA